MIRALVALFFAVTLLSVLGFGFGLIEPDVLLALLGVVIGLMPWAVILCGIAADLARIGAP